MRENMKMRVQILASVMNQSLKGIAEKMRLDSDAIIINQCDRLGYEELEYNGHNVRFFRSLTEGWEEAGMKRSCGQTETSACFLMRTLSMSRDMPMLLQRSLRRILMQT